MSQSQHTETRPAPINHKGHTSFVCSVAFAPDGKSIASSSWDNTIRFWDVHRPSPIGEPLTANYGVAHSVSYSSLGGIIASGWSDDTVRLWDTNTHLQHGEPLKGHMRNVRSVAFSPRGDLIASGSYDTTIRLWDVQKLRPASGPFKSDDWYILSVAFSPDGTRIASGSVGARISIWDVKQGVMIGEPLEGHKNTVRSVVVSPDGSLIASGSDDKTVRLWDTRSGVTVGKPFKGHTGRVDSVAFSPCGLYVASGSGDKTVRVWDVRSGRQADKPFKQHTGVVHSVAYSPSGRHIASGSADGTVVIWDSSGIDSDVAHDSPAMTEGVSEMIEVDSPQLVGRHMSVQDMLSMLSQRGCGDLSSQMDQNQNGALLVSGGGFGDIWRTELLDGTRVAIKTWREALINMGDYKTLKRAVREIYYWSKMNHENVQRLMGVVMFKGQSIGMASEWMDNGNLHEYLHKNPNIDRSKLCIGAASGVSYIHNLNMVHGDIKAFNVLVSSDGVAKLTDFGISTMSESSIAFSATTTSQAGSLRWAAPELLEEDWTKTRDTDVYALGMTILEILTGTLPYPECPRDYSVMMKVSQGIPPVRPTNVIRDDERGNRMWELLMTCWKKDPDSRPSAKQIVELLILI